MEVRADLTVEQRRALKSISIPLGLIFWGMVLVVFDFNLRIGIADRLVQVDLLPDSVGLCLMAAGMAVLAFSSLFDGKAGLVITLSAGVYIALALLSITSIFLPVLRNLPASLNAFLQLVAGAAIVGFCAAMSQLTSKFGAFELSSSWLVLAGGTLLLYTAPQLLAFVLPVATPVTMGMSLLLALFVGLSLFRIIRRTRKLADSAFGPGRVHAGAI